MQFEINTPDNTPLTIEAVDAFAAVPIVLALLGLRGDELMLDERTIGAVTTGLMGVASIRRLKSLNMI
jgi:hypothetical protein